MELAAYEPDSGIWRRPTLSPKRFFLTAAAGIGVQLISRRPGATNFSNEVGADRRSANRSRGEIHAPVVIAAAGPWGRVSVPVHGIRSRPIETEFTRWPS